MRTIASVIVLAVVASSAQAGLFFDQASYDNGDWDTTAGALGPILELDYGLSAGDLTANVPLPLGSGVSAVANGPDANNDSIGFGVTLGGTTTEFSFTFTTPIRGFALDIANGNVTNGLTIDTGVATYDVEAANGGAVIGFIGVVEPDAFSTVTFRVTDPAGTTELFFLDEPLRYVEIPTPGTAGLLGLAGLAALRRQR